LHKRDKKEVKFICLDNAGENKSFSEFCKRNPDLAHITFEFTAPGTPQQNGAVERSLATMYGKVRAMLNHAGSNQETRGKIWAEAANCATDNENVRSLRKGEKSAYEKFYDKKANYAIYMRTFGEIGIVKNVHQNKVWKLENKGIPAMFCGYAKEHAGNVYKMLNLQTRKIILCRDVQWLGKTYGEYMKIGQNEVTKVNSINYDDDYESDEGNGNKELNPQHDGNDENYIENNDAENEDECEENVQNVVGGRLGREPNRLDMSYNPTSNAGVNIGGMMTTRSGITHYANLMFEHIEIGLNVPVVEDETPESFQEAWHHPDHKKREKWQEAICNEFHNMVTKKESLKTHQKAKCTFKLDIVFMQMGVCNKK
jgi:hypothetical protein